MRAGKDAKVSSPDLASTKAPSNCSRASSMLPLWSRWMASLHFFWHARPALINPSLLTSCTSRWFVIRSQSQSIRSSTVSWVHGEMMPDLILLTHHRFQSTFGWMFGLVSWINRLTDRSSSTAVQLKASKLHCKLTIIPL